MNNPWRLVVSKALGFSGDDPSQAMKHVYGASVVLGENIENMTVSEAVAKVNSVEKKYRMKAYNSRVLNHPNWRDEIKSDDRSVKNVKMTHDGGCGELHFHNCDVKIYINQKGTN